MIFLSPKNTLISLGFGLIFALSGSLLGMETYYGNLAPKASWLQVPMNNGTHEQVSPSMCINIWTDKLEGCVVTLLDLEYANGQHILAMSHFSHDKKSYNEYYLQELVRKLERENNFHSITKASCIIIPPGIQIADKLKPILDPEWQRMIVETIHTKIPQASITINPYLFNVEKSAVKFSFDKGKTKTTIINKSRIEDTAHHNQLLVSHSYKDESICVRLAPLILAIATFTGYIAWNMH